MNLFKIRLNKKLVTTFVFIVFLSSPVFVLALDSPAEPIQIDSSQIWSNIVVPIIDLIWPLCFGLAIIMFIVAGIMFITSNGDPGKVASARNAVIWGVVGVIVAVAAFSIPYIILNTTSGHL